MMTEMAVRFKWDWNKTFGESLFVRATPIFADNEYQESRVVRCFVHRIANDPSNKNVPSTALNHIMHSLKEGDEISYCGDDDSNNTWLSVATHYPEAPSIGSDCHHHVYRFSCKHSCTSGINRRRIEVLFTLENLE